MDDERLTAVARLWQDHRRAAFPSRLRGVEIADLDMVLLDADTAGHVLSWLNDAGQLTPRVRSGIITCLNNLNRVLPLLEDPVEADYYRRLRDLTSLISDSTN